MIETLSIILCIPLFIFGCIVWYIMHGLDGYLNGFPYDNQFLMPFQYWYSNLKLLKEDNRVDFIYKLVHNMKTGYISGYRVEDIIEKSLYKEVSNKVVPGFGSFILMNTAPFLPLIIHLTCWSIFK